MSAVRICRPRLLRPDLSTRYQSLRRTQSTVSSPSATPTPPPPPPPPPSFFKRNRSTIVWTSLAFLTGLIGGQVVVHTISPPQLPSKGTRGDDILMSDLNKRIDEEFKVKVLRGKCLAMAKQLKGDEGGWVEVIPLPLELNGKDKAEEGLVGQLQGAKGMGVERLFWDRGENILVAVVWFGGSLCGWPGVTHGGAIATAMAEKLSLAAALADKASSDVLAAATPQRIPGTGNHAKMLSPATTPDEPAQLSMGYSKPTYANQFYVIRVQPALPQEGNPAKMIPEPEGGADYEATLETLDAHVCVTARAKFAPSTQMQRVTKKATGGAMQSYQDFKEWLWPSRQKQSQIN